jgi:hypothetical protein
MGCSGQAAPPLNPLRRRHRAPARALAARSVERGRRSCESVQWGMPDTPRGPDARRPGRPAR